MWGGWFQGDLSTLQCALFVLFLFIVYFISIVITSALPQIRQYIPEAGSLCSQFSSVQVSQSCPTLGDPKDCSTPGLPVHQQLPEVTQTHVHRVGDAIQPSHPLSSPSPPAFNLSQHQGLFQ